MSTSRVNRRDTEICIAQQTRKYSQGFYSEEDTRHFRGNNGLSASSTGRNRSYQEPKTNSPDAKCKLPINANLLTRLDSSLTDELTLSTFELILRNRILPQLRKNKLCDPLFIYYFTLRRQIRNKFARQSFIIFFSHMIIIEI